MMLTLQTLVQDPAAGFCQLLFQSITSVSMNMHMPLHAGLT